MAPLKGQVSESDTPAGSPSHRSSLDAGAVRLQLEHLLGSPHFRTSKRCQALLIHIVGAYLEGALDRVKERIIGSEVFGRDPGYDTNQDSVVRTTAAEVRKRLAQYYMEPNHEREIRLLLPPGSYVPEFRLPAPVAAALSTPAVPGSVAAGLSAPAVPGFAAAALSAPAVPGMSASALLVPLPAVDARAAPLPAVAARPPMATGMHPDVHPEVHADGHAAPVHTPWPGRWIWAALALACVAAAVVWWLPHFRQTELDAFWRPLLEDPADIVICIEQPLRIYAFEGTRVDELNAKMVGTAASPAASSEALKGASLNLSELKTVGNRYFAFGDTIALVRVAELLARKGKPFQVLGDRATSYRDLRGRPAVLVGEFNNQWTNGLIRGLRYYLEKNAENYTYEVRDRQNAGRVIASVSREVTRPMEYAIVSRVFDAATEKTVIAVAGMTYAGNGAVGDFLTNPAYMRAAFQGAQAGWQRKSIQVVLETTLVGGIAGPPKVVATHFW